MNKRLIIFTVASLTWCVALGFFAYKQVEKFQWTDGKTATSVVAVSAEVSAVLPQKDMINQVNQKVVTVLAFGDMMLDRKVRDLINTNGPEYPFAQIKDLLKDNDVVLANAEGPFTHNKSVTLGKVDGPLKFTLNPATLPTLKDLGFTLLGQANNHIFDFGTAGFKESLLNIEKAGLSWVADPRNASNASATPYIANIRDEKVAFIGYNEFTAGPLATVLQAIKDAKKTATFVVVYAHWGDEYKLVENAFQQKIGHAFIDAGADVVVGMHPHVIEPIEIYNDKPIFYSLGNFIFDQAQTGPLAEGLAVKISLTQNTSTYYLSPFSIIKEQAVPMTTAGQQKILDRINGSSGIIISSKTPVIQ